MSSIMPTHQPPGVPCLDNKLIRRNMAKATLATYHWMTIKSDTSLFCQEVHRWITSIWKIWAMLGTCVPLFCAPIGRPFDSCQGVFWQAKHTGLKGGASGNALKKHIGNLGNMLGTKEKWKWNK
jgi:hypothetical protein